MVGLLGAFVVVVVLVWRARAARLVSFRAPRALDARVSVRQRVCSVRGRLSVCLSNCLSPHALAPAQRDDSGDAEEEAGDAEMVKATDGKHSGSLQVRACTVRQVRTRAAGHGRRGG